MSTTEKQVLARMKELIATGSTYKEVAQQLTVEGYRTKLGKTWTEGNICVFLSKRRGLLKPAKVKTTNTIAGVSRSVIESLLTDPHLNDNQRVKMISAYVQT